jgi:hypothetical protein
MMKGLWVAYKGPTIHYSDSLADAGVQTGCYYTISRSCLPLLLTSELDRVQPHDAAAIDMLEHVDCSDRVERGPAVLDEGCLEVWCRVERSGAFNDRLMIHGRVNSPCTRYCNALSK